MASVTKKMTASQIDDLYKRIKPVSIRETRPQHSKWSLRTSDMVVVAYNTGKVVFQGKDLDWLMEDEKIEKSGFDQQSLSQDQIFPCAGSDEVGTGDYFGPVTVAAVIVENEEQKKWLKSLGINDSKQVNDEKIRKMAPLIMDKLPYSVQVLSPVHYNIVRETQHLNLNAIKARMHNQAYLNLKKKGYALPDLKIVDQFASKKNYFSYLKKVPEVIQDIHFEMKAESKYIAVAAASVLARYAFLKAWDAMEKEWNFTFEKGGGHAVDLCGVKFLESHYREDLGLVAKEHFANTKKIEELWLKEE